LRIIEQGLVVSKFRSGRRQLALGRFRRSFSSVDLRGGGEILALCIVQFLLRHDAGLSLEDPAQSRVLKMQRVVLRIVALQFVICAAHLVHRVLDLSLILLQLRLQFGNFQDSHDLAGFYMRPIVNAQRFDVAGFLRIDVDFLKRHQFGGQSNLPAQRFHYHVGHPDRDCLLRTCLNFLISCAAAR
jgi:hypothetical protein